MLAEGHTQQQVADAANVPQKAISKFAAKPEIRQQIQGLQFGIVQEAGELAKDNTVQAITIANQIYRRAAESEQPRKVIEENRVALELDDKKEKRVLTLMGISGAPTMPIFCSKFFKPLSRTALSRLVRWRSS